jgi:septum formation protein
MESSIKYKVFLGSKSPRRKELLAGLDIPFEEFIIETKEVYPLGLVKYEITDFLASLKAAAYIDKLAYNELIITADTIVWSNGKALGKPKDRDDAFLMLQEMAGNSHEVYTSVCIKSNKKEIVFHDTSKVFFDKLSDEEINYYINNYKPFDKAGAYGIQDWIGIRAISKIEGSYYNVMGLPTQKLYTELLKF